VLPLKDLKSNYRAKGKKTAKLPDLQENWGNMRDFRAEIATEGRTVGF